VLGGRSVVEEPRERLVDDGEVAGEDQRALRWVRLAHSVIRSKKQFNSISRFFMWIRLNGLPV